MTFLLLNLCLLKEIAHLYTSAFKFVFMEEYFISMKILQIPILVCMYWLYCVYKVELYVWKQKVKLAKTNSGTASTFPDLKPELVVNCHSQASVNNEQDDLDDDDKAAKASNVCLGSPTQ